MALMLRRLQHVGGRLLSLFYPPHCTECGAGVEAGTYLCSRCAETAWKIRAPRCHTCSQPFDGEICGSFSCPNCEDRKFHFAAAIAPFRSRGVVRNTIHRFKYQRHYYLRHVLAGWLLTALDDERLAHVEVDALVPVPLHPTKEREREFNQSVVLAKELSRMAEIPMLHCLRRVRATSTQTALDREGRIQNLRNAFRIRHSPRVKEKHLLLVDDVFTTGSTADACTRVLTEAGAASVHVITVARG